MYMYNKFRALRVDVMPYVYMVDIRHKKLAFPFATYDK